MTFASVFNYRRGTSNYPNQVRQDSPLFYLRLQEPSGTTAADSSGNARDFTYSPGTGTINKGQASPLNSDPADYSVSFAPAGANNCNIQHAASTAWDNANVSFEAWVHPTSGQGSNLGVGGVNSSATRWNCILTSADGTVLIVDNGGTFTAPTAKCTLNAWSHLVITFDGTNWRIYVNAVLKDTSGSRSLGASTNQPFFIGNVNASGANRFVGGMDEVALYSTVLNATRISAHYNASA